MHQRDDNNDSSDKCVLDALLRYTVHAFVFGDDEVRRRCATSKRSAPALELIVGQTPAPAAASALLNRLTSDGSTSNGDDADPRYVHHCARVLQCQHWSNTQLETEKRAVYAYLQQHSSEAATCDRSIAPVRTLYCVYETYALLKLFLNERSTQTLEHVDGLKTSNEREQFLLGLHVQLELYAKYFERAQQRKVRVVVRRACALVCSPTWRLLPHSTLNARHVSRSRVWTTSSQ